MTTFIGFLQNVIGSPNNIIHVEEVSNINDFVASSYVSQVIEYDLEYIFAFILVLVINIGIFKLLSNFQKSFSTGRRAKK